MAVAALSLVAAGMVRAETAVERYATQAATEAMAIARAGGTNDRVAARFATVMRRYGDIDQVATFSLGPYRKALPSARRREFNRLVVMFAGGLFATYVAEFAGERLEIIGSREHGPRDFIVRSRIHFADGKQPSEIEWRILQTPHGPKVFDLKVIGIWLALKMRSTFVSILKQNQGDMGALFAYLKQ